MRINGRPPADTRSSSAPDLPSELSSADVIWEMPPFPAWFSGPRHIGRHLELRCTSGLRLVPTAANGQPALAAYQRDGDGAYRIVNIQCSCLTVRGIDHVVNFLDRRLFTTFGLLPTLSAVDFAARPESR